MFETVMLTAVMMSGPERVPVSDYRGVHYSKRWEPFRKCVVWRESRGDYRARNSRSSAAGAYQFLASQWRDSLVHMIRPEHGKRVNVLFKVPLHKWPKFYQDAAFWTVLDRGNGWRHWYLAGSSCNRKVVR
jgi:hypothetical protein